MEKKKCYKLIIEPTLDMRWAKTKQNKNKNKTKVGNSHKKNIQVVEKKWKERDNLHREIIQIK